MIEISIKENPNDKRGDAVGTDCKFTVKGNGGMIAAQIAYLFDVLDDQIPADVLAAGLGEFLKKRGL